MPPSPTKTLKDAMSSPVREILTVQGQIIRDEAIKTVKVAQKDTKIRALTLEENGQTMELTLWRELSEQELKIGQYIEVTHCLVSEWLRKKSLNSTRNTTIKGRNISEHACNEGETTQFLLYRDRGPVNRQT